MRLWKDSYGISTIVFVYQPSALDLEFGICFHSLLYLCNTLYCYFVGRPDDNRLPDDKTPLKFLTFFWTVSGFLLCHIGYPARLENDSGLFSNMCGSCIEGMGEDGNPGLDKDSRLDREAIGRMGPLTGRNTFGIHDVPEFNLLVSNVSVQVVFTMCSQLNTVSPITRLKLVLQIYQKIQKKQTGEKLSSGTLRVISNNW